MSRLARALAFFRRAPPAGTALWGPGRSGTSSLRWRAVARSMSDKRDSVEFLDNGYWRGSTRASPSPGRLRPNAPWDRSRPGARTAPMGLGNATAAPKPSGQRWGLSGSSTDVRPGSQASLKETTRGLDDVNPANRPRSVGRSQLSSRCCREAPAGCERPRVGRTPADPSGTACMSRSRRASL